MFDVMSTSFDTLAQIKQIYFAQASINIASIDARTACFSWKFDIR